MIVWVFSESANYSSRGKLTRVQLHHRSMTVRLKRTDPKAAVARPSLPPWQIEIRGETSDEKGTGERGGEVETVNREVRIQLAPDDLNQLLAVVQRHRLLTTLDSKRARRRRRA